MLDIGKPAIESYGMHAKINLDPTSYPIVPPHISVSEFMGYLKSKSSLMIFDKHANLKYKDGNRHFWCRGYYVDTVGKYETAIRQYIRNQLQEDISNDQISMKELFDPFTGEPEK